MVFVMELRRCDCPFALCPLPSFWLETHLVYTYKLSVRPTKSRMMLLVTYFVTVASTFRLIGMGAYVRVLGTGNDRMRAKRQG